MPSSAVSAATPRLAEDAEGLMLFADEAPPALDDAAPHWRLLVIDDEADVHLSTAAALAGVRILGRPLQFLHAHSAHEATQLLQREKDIAVVLLDVVMEREDSGLALVRTIREELGLSGLRIILRTGQPGYAPELQTIHDYDINDYRTKSELTRAKLFASVTSALRAYQQIQALDQLAFYDRLSQLPNRNRFLTLVEECLVRDKAGDQVIAIIDIDDFAEINDALGHQQGDRLLQAVAERLAQSLGGDATLARLGGDAFGLLGPESQLEPQRVLALFHQPFVVQGDSMLVTATLGLRRLEGATGQAVDLLKDANIALKRAKKTHRGQHVVFSEDMGAEIRQRVDLLQGLRAAMDSEHLFVVLQPQAELDTGQLVGFEALLRWRRADGHLVPPDRFIPLAERSGLIVPIGDWVLRTACRALQELNRLGVQGVRMSVNVSHNQFRHPAFPGLLAAALAGAEIDPACVELEITESVAMEDPARVAALIAQLKETGVSIAIDDFGTGYSSLSQLRHLPVDRLKIDRAFVMGLQHSPQSGVIAATVVELGRNLNLTVIAEGIEHEAEAQALRDLGCHEGQGYWFAHPMEMQDLWTWLARRTTSLPVQEPLADGRAG